jgi:hypothetical protein
MSPHVSVFEVATFLRSGFADDEFEQHVSHCDACAQLLERRAQTQFSQSEPTPFRVPSVWLMVSTAVVSLVMLSGMRAKTPTDASLRNPEGVHGVAWQPGPGLDGIPMAEDAGLNSLNQ